MNVTTSPVSSAFMVIASSLPAHFNIFACAPRVQITTSRAGSQSLARPFAPPRPRARVDARTLRDARCIQSTRAHTPTLPRTPTLARASSAFPRSTSRRDDADPRALASIQRAVSRDATDETHERRREKTKQK